MLWPLPAGRKNLLLKFLCPHFILTVQCLDIPVEKTLDLQVGLADKASKGVSCLVKRKSRFGCSCCLCWCVLVVHRFHNTVLQYY